VKLPPEAPAGPVVSTEWLATNLGADGLRVVDVRGKVQPPGSNPRYLAKREDYERAHLRDAVFIDWTRDIVDPADPVPVQIAPPDAFAAKMNELGIGDDTLVVAYDDYDHIFAGRLAWALRFYGHDDVRILDGGYARWVSEGRPTTQELPPPCKSERGFHARPRPGLRRTGEEVAHAVGDAGVLVLDARSPEQYAGSMSAAGRGGHIPGARNVPYPLFIDASTGQFLPQEELRRAFARAGVDVGKLPPEVVVYCNGGVSCTVPLTALQLLGRNDVAVYDGSWNEWGNDPVRPVKTGSEP
jgi:thiosulfate/3-mercaptopyruvate sulfurtransferase